MVAAMLGWKVQRSVAMKLEMLRSLVVVTPVSVATNVATEKKFLVTLASRVATGVVPALLATYPAAAVPTMEEASLVLLGAPAKHTATPAEVAPWALLALAVPVSSIPKAMIAPVLARVVPAVLGPVTTLGEPAMSATRV